jgi:hypothetical protein
MPSYPGRIRILGELPGIRCFDPFVDNRAERMTPGVFAEVSMLRCSARTIRQTDAPLVSPAYVFRSSVSDGPTYRGSPRLGVMNRARHAKSFDAGQALALV